MIGYVMMLGSTLIAASMHGSLRSKLNGMFTEAEPEVAVIVKASDWFPYT